VTRSELVQKIAAKHPTLLPKDVDSLVGWLFDAISAALVRGERVELRGFGTFSLKQRQPRLGRNPRTGAAVAVASKKIPFFKTGKQLHQRLNGQATGAEDDGFDTNLPME